MLTLIVIRARDIDRLAQFYSVLGLQFSRHRHGAGPEHLSAMTGETVFEIYPAATPSEITTATRLGFSVPSLEKAISDFRNLNATILTGPAESPFGRRAVVKDFEGHKVELYEKVT
jgi:lactoylglutathione lyase